MSVGIKIRVKKTLFTNVTSGLPEDEIKPGVQKTKIRKRQIHR